MTKIKCDKCGQEGVYKVIPPKPPEETLSMDEYFDKCHCNTMTLEMKYRIITLRCPNCGYERGDII